MRSLIVNLLATALLLFGASSASAFALNATLNPGSVAEGVALSASDLIIIDVYLDADPGLGFLGVALTFDDNGVVTYEQGLSSVSSYILYTGGKGATYLIPNIDPPAQWGGVNQPGKLQVNVDYLEVALGSATATGAGIWISTLVFHVTGPGTVDLDLTLNANGTIVEAYAVDVKGLTTTSGSFSFGLGVPEPTTAMLIGFGLIGLTMAGRRKD